MWFTEDASSPIIICLLALAAVVVGWYATQKRALFVVAILLIASCVAIYVIEKVVVTDAEQVEANVHALVSAFQRDDLETTLSYISKQAPELRADIVWGMEAVDVDDDLRVTDLAVKTTTGGTRAESVFRANASLTVVGYGEVGRRPSRWRLTWQKESDQWRVIKAERLNPVSGEVMDVRSRTEN